ncbi:hypothetical protein D3C87_1439850 [compost metagenome]
MKASMRPRVIINPLPMPAAPPTARPAAIPMRITPSDIPIDGIRAFMTMIMMPATTAAMEPTDRSSPPDVITKVAPMAMMPMKLDRASTLVMLL